MFIEPYLSFNGPCEEAFNYYQEKLGAKILFMQKFKDTPVPAEHTPEGGADKIMHALLQIGDSKLMASDGYCTGTLNFDGFSLSIQAEDKAEAERLFNAIAEEGSITMPFGETFWSPGFGMATDKFGLHWMFNTFTQDSGVS